MKTKEKAPEGANIFAETQDKDNDSSTLRKVLEIFLSGQKVTAHGLNIKVGFNDSRKAISLLRSHDYPIQDYRLADMRKVYWLPSDWERIRDEAKQANKQQLTLFNDDTN